MQRDGFNATDKPITGSYQQISSATLASAIALTAPGTARRARVNVEAQSVRWRDDGTNPDANTGMLLTAGRLRAPSHPDIALDVPGAYSHWN